MSYKRHDVDSSKINDLRFDCRIVKRRSSLCDGDAAVQHAGFRIVKERFQPAKRNQRA
jgi:hypothetical protein